jgi:hypothetical protein
MILGIWYTEEKFNNKINIFHVTFIGSYYLLGAQNTFPLDISSKANAFIGVLLMAP